MADRCLEDEVVRFRKSFSRKSKSPCSGAFLLLLIIAVRAKLPWAAAVRDGVGTTLVSVYNPAVG